jgi:hypothetical protein
VLRIEHVHWADEGADCTCELEQVRLRGGGDDRAGVLHDHVGQERRLVGPRRGHDQQVLLQRDAKLVPVVSSAEEHRMLARVEQAVAPWKGGADLAGAA